MHALFELLWVRVSCMVIGGVNWLKENGKRGVAKEVI